MNQSQPYGAVAPRRTATYGSQHQSDELHISPTMSHSHQAQLSPRDFTTAPANPHIKLEQPATASQPATPAYHQGNSAVPNVLQPGVGALGGRPAAMSANTAPTLPTMSGTMQHSPSEYTSPSSKPPALSLSHSYSRSSPTAPYEQSNTTYSSYTPTTPGMSLAGPSSQLSSQDKYGAPGSQRNVSNTPLGLADIRPRADSSLSEGNAAGFGSDAHPSPMPSSYIAPWAMYSFDWCKWPSQGNGAGKIAIGSYLEDGHNFIQILDTQIVNTPTEMYTPGSSKFCLEFNRIAEATHSYPVTRLLWEPPSSQKQTTDLLATSGDHLRLWSLPADQGGSYTNRIKDKFGSLGNNDPGHSRSKLTPLALLSNSKTPDHTAPLTSLDWNTVSPSLIITSSIDTTCTIWDIPSLTAKTQLIAHDKEVYDVRFCANSVDVFVSCGQDGSVRMFDLRSLEHSTIIYEPTAKDDRGNYASRSDKKTADRCPDANGGRISPTLAQQTMSNAPPLMRLAASPHDAHLLATFAQDSNVVRILDVRQPGQALLELRGHSAAVSSIEWSPNKRGTLASGGDDSQVLIWDLTNPPMSSPSPAANTGPDKHLTPVAAWQCDYEVHNLSWTTANGDAGEWLGVGGGRGIYGVKMA
ncbi:WD40-repeat-containing domain protein [Pseudomassariella vexata]|uniref:WD40-repeat-containing domain protein n=1 Tax=Pseudomassariella vexata TaxID=1141098 RepID=A0A1Y2E643_9PEZI|nr:WD40-repeat-containing domain protein [Pseudomassariella vexata]ORY66979.1 WD40-repeat-containing domain protein [Pseudomassariella vexata]